MVPESWPAVVAVVESSQPVQRIQALDIFAGQGHLCEALVDSGIEARKYELQDCASEDILSLEACEHQSYVTNVGSSAFPKAVGS